MEFTGHMSCQNIQTAFGFGHMNGPLLYIELDIKSVSNHGSSRMILLYPKYGAAVPKHGPAWPVGPTIPPHI